MYMGGAYSQDSSDSMQLSIHDAVILIELSQVLFLHSDAYLGIWIMDTLATSENMLISGICGLYKDGDGLDNIGLDNVITQNQ